MRADHISHRVAAMEHDVPFWSLFMGEPRVFDNLLAYYDGRQLFLVGAALNNREPASDEIVQGVFDYATSRLGIEYFECWRPGAPPQVEVGEWRTGEYREVGVPMAVSLQGFTLEGSTKRLKQVRQAEHRGFHSEFGDDGHLRDDDIRLIQDFIATKELAPFDISYTMWVGFFINSPYGRLIRIKRDGKTCALGTISTFSADRTIFVHTFVDRSERGASDMLYREVINIAIERGSRHLDLGYSSTPALADYKSSWGATVIGETNGGFFASAGHMPPSTFYHWPARLLVGERF
jgi:hypothetical protein